METKITRIKDWNLKFYMVTSEQEGKRGNARIVMTFNLARNSRSFDLSMNKIVYEQMIHRRGCVV